MYRAFFGFRESPFRITPDPRFLYRSPVYDEAMQALVDGILDRAGFLALIGEVGTGKTTLQRHLIEALPEHVKTVLLLHPTVTFDETLDHILMELGIPVEGASKLVLLQRLNEFLIEHTNDGGNVALFFDEAQALEPAAIEELALLCDLRTTDGRPGLQILLAGQPELGEKLALPELTAIRDRIAVEVRLFPLAVDEVTDYIRTRLDLAGGLDLDVFTPPAIGRIAELTGGIPRLVNVLADASLVAAYAAETRRVTPELVDDAWADYAPLHAGRPLPMPERPELPAAPEPTVLYVAPPPPRSSHTVPIAAALALIVVSGGVAWRLSRPEPTETVRARALPMRVVGPVPTVPLPVAEPEPEPEPTPEPIARPEPPPPEPEPEPVLDAAPTESGVSPPSAVEALDLVDAFRRAAERRDYTKLRTLLADDVTANDVTADYERRLPRTGAVTWNQPRADVEPQGERVEVRAPFVITYRNEQGRPVEMRGSAAWEIGRRDGAPIILAHRLSSDDG